MLLNSYQGLVVKGVVFNYWGSTTENRHFVAFGDIEQAYLDFVRLRKIRLNLDFVRLRKITQLASLWNQSIQQTIWRRICTHH